MGSTPSVRIDVVLRLRGSLHEIQGFVDIRPPGVEIVDLDSSTPAVHLAPPLHLELLRYLETRGITNAAFAARIGVDKATVGRVLKNGTKARHLIKKIRDAITKDDHAPNPT